MAQKGRLKKVDQEYRFIILCKFIYTFKYVTRKELDRFVNVIMGIKYPQWLIEYSVARGLVKTYSDTTFRTKIYYLSNNGVGIIGGTERLADYYRFEKDRTGLPTYVHHMLLVETYILLKKQFNIKEWVSEWGIKVGKRRFEKLPDGLLKFDNGLNIALEAETSYKRLPVWRWFIKRYEYAILKRGRYDGVLLVAAQRGALKSIILRVVEMNPEFCNSSFIFTDPAMIKAGECFYNNGVKYIQDALNLLKEEVDKRKEANPSYGKY